MKTVFKYIVILILVTYPGHLFGQRNDLEYYANRYVNSPELSRVLSYSEVFRINAAEAKALSYDLENMARLDIQTKDPNELLRAYNSKVNEINEFVGQKQKEINNQLLSKAATVILDKAVLNQSADPVDLVSSALSGLLQSNKVDEEREKALRAVEVEMQGVMNNIRNEVLGTNQKTINDLLGSAAESFSEADERYFIDFANYYICYNKSINTNFNYKNTDWISKNNCEKPVKPFNIPNLIQTKWDQYLLAGKRKNELFKQYNDDRFLTASIKFVNTAITSNNKFVDAYYFKSSVVPNSAEKYINILIANNLDPQNRKYILEKDVAFNVFKQDFFKAIAENDVPYIQIALQYDLEKSFYGTPSENPVLFSINSNNPDALQLLLNKEASATQNLANRLQGLLFLSAIKNADKCAERLIKLGVGADSKEANGQTPMFLAARYNSGKVADILLNYNIDVEYNLNFAKKNQTDNEYITLGKFLGIRLIRDGKIDELVKLVNSCQGLYKEPVASGESFIEYLTKNITSTEMFPAVLAKVENYYKNEKQLLLLALKADNIYSTQVLLLDNDIDINLLDSIGNSAFNYALGNKNKKIALEIFGKNPKVDVANSAGVFPIHLAAQYNHTEAIIKILGKGVNVNQPDGNGDTPLNYAVQAQSIDAIKVLLNSNADVFIKNSSGDLVQEIARKTKNKKVIEIILKAVRTATNKLPIPSRTFVLYNISGTAPFGVMFGKADVWGWYGSVRTNGSLEKGAYICNDEMLIDYDGDGYYKFTNVVKRSRLSIQGGVNHQLSRYFSIYGGAGYGLRHLLWNVTEFSYSTNNETGNYYVDYENYLHKGIEIEAGLLGFYKKISFCLGVNAMGFKHFEVTGGIGIVLK
jgi:ankyrin repeat protein